jgi:hypothetical protein
VFLVVNDSLLTGNHSLHTVDYNSSGENNLAGWNEVGELGRNAISSKKPLAEHYPLDELWSRISKYQKLATVSVL